jgi:hypothetical protein
MIGAFTFLFVAVTFRVITVGQHTSDMLIAIALFVVIFGGAILFDFYRQR